MSADQQLLISPKRSHLDDPGLDNQQIRLDDIWIRDPFVMIKRDPLQGSKYLLFGTSDKPPDKDRAYARYPATGLAYYEAYSLNGPWTGPRMAFVPRPGFWSATQFWAPEVVQFGDYFYMCATFGGAKKGRSCQILRSKQAEGPFAEFSPPVTPAEWMCLDGHLYFGESEPCLVFCREWVDVHDGEMYLMRLSGDLARALGEPHLLFKASDADWTAPLDVFGKNYVTDGPFLWRSRATRELVMLWSSMGDKGYCVGLSRSSSGTANGPWTHDDALVFDEDGGHCMLFRPFNACLPIWDGSGPPPLVLSLHRPNRNPMDSRAHFYLLNEVVRDGKCYFEVDLTRAIK